MSTPSIQNKLFDTHISLFEAAAGLASAAIFGGAGIGLAHIRREQQNGPAAIEYVSTQTNGINDALAPLMNSFDTAAVAVNPITGQAGALNQGGGIAVATLAAGAAMAIPTALTGVAVYDIWPSPNRHHLTIIYSVMPLV